MIVKYYHGKKASEKRGKDLTHVIEGYVSQRSTPLFKDVGAVLQLRKQKRKGGHSGGGKRGGEEYKGRRTEPL